MAESDKTKTSENNDENTAPMQALPMQIHAQYLRDSSFENPAVPDSLRPGQETPKSDISVNMDARKIIDDKIEDLYEVSLKVSATAKRGNDVVFIAEVEYGTLVSMQNIPEDKQHPLLLIEVPRLTFPFVRQALSDLTQQGGYPPLLLNPVDFGALYIQRFASNEALNGDKDKQKH